MLVPLGTSDTVVATNIVEECSSTCLLASYSPFLFVACTILILWMGGYFGRSALNCDKETASVVDNSQDVTLEFLRLLATSAFFQNTWKILNEPTFLRTPRGVGGPHGNKQVCYSSEGASERETTLSAFHLSDGSPGSSTGGHNGGSASASASAAADGRGTKVFASVTSRVPIELGGGGRVSKNLTR